MSSLSHLSVQQLRRAASIKEKIAKLEKQLSDILGEPAKSANGAVPKKRRRKLSKAARAKISAAQKKRWSKTKRDKK